MLAVKRLKRLTDRHQAVPNYSSYFDPTRTSVVVRTTCPKSQPRPCGSAIKRYLTGWRRRFPETDQGKPGPFFRGLLLLPALDVGGETNFDLQT
jgi:hypothetical protein